MECIPIKHIKTKKEASPFMIHPISRKIVAVFLMFALTLTIVMPGWAAVTYGREKLKGDSKAMQRWGLRGTCSQSQDQAELLADFTSSRQDLRPV
jgi:hypothetical protein